MKEIEVCTSVNHNTFLAAVTLLAVILAAGSLNTVLAQGSQDRTIERAQQAVRQLIISQDGQRNLTVLFNNDAQTTFISRTEVRVNGTGTFTDDIGGRSRTFTYEAIVNPRSRSGGVTGVTYDVQGGRIDAGRVDTGRDNNRSGYDRGNRPAGGVIYSGPIMNHNSDKGLDVAGESMRDGANIQQWSYAEQPNQNWEVIDLGNGEAAIISQLSGKALTVQGRRAGNGANIIQQRWNGSRQQRWRLEKVNDDYYRIVSVDNGKCLDVAGESREDGANIQLWDYANQANQQWRLRR